jgi:hypothetical protein
MPWHSSGMSDWSLETPPTEYLVTQPRFEPVPPEQIYRENIIVLWYVSPCILVELRQRFIITAIETSELKSETARNTWGNRQRQKCRCFCCSVSFWMHLPVKVTLHEHSNSTEFGEYTFFLVVALCSSLEVYKYFVKMNRLHIHVRRVSQTKNKYEAGRVSHPYDNHSCGNLQSSSIDYCIYLFDRLCGLVVGVPGHRTRGPGSVPCTTRFSEK